MGQDLTTRLKQIRLNLTNFFSKYRVIREC